MISARPARRYSDPHVVSTRAEIKSDPHAPAEFSSPSSPPAPNAIRPILSRRRRTASLPNAVGTALERDSLRRLLGVPALRQSPFISNVAFAVKRRPAERADWLLATQFHPDGAIRRHEFAAYARIADRLPGDLGVLPHARLLGLEAQTSASVVRPASAAVASLADVHAALAAMLGASDDARATHVDSIVGGIADLPHRRGAVVVHLASLIPSVPELRRTATLLKLVEASSHVPITEREPVFRTLIASVTHLDFRLRHTPVEHLIKSLSGLSSTSIVPLYHETSRAVETVAPQHRTRLRTYLAAVMKRVPASSAERNAALLRHMRANHLRAIPRPRPLPQTNASHFITMHERKLGHQVPDTESLGGGSLVTVARAKPEHRVAIFDQQMNSSTHLPLRQQGSAFLELAGALRLLPVAKRANQMNNILLTIRPLSLAAHELVLRGLAHVVVFLPEADCAIAANTLLDRLDVLKSQSQANRAELVFALIGALPAVPSSERTALFERLLHHATPLPYPTNLVCFGALANRAHHLPSEDALPSISAVISVIGAKPVGERGLTMYAAAANLALMPPSLAHAAVVAKLEAYEPGFTTTDVRTGRRRSQYERLHDLADGSAGTLDAQWFEELDRMGEEEGAVSSDSDNETHPDLPDLDYRYSDDSDASLSQGSLTDASDED